MQGEDAEGPVERGVVASAEANHPQDEEGQADYYDADVPDGPSPGLAVRRARGRFHHGKDGEMCQHVPNVRRVKVRARLDKVVQLVEGEAEHEDVKEDLPDSDGVHDALQRDDVEEGEKADEEEDLKGLYVARHAQAAPRVAGAAAVEARLLDGADGEAVPEDDVAPPDAVDHVLDGALAQELLGPGHGRDLERVEVHEGLCEALATAGWLAGRPVAVAVAVAVRGAVAAVPVGAAVRRAPPVARQQSRLLIIVRVGPVLVVVIVQLKQEIVEGVLL